MNRVLRRAVRRLGQPFLAFSRPGRSALYWVTIWMVGLAFPLTGRTAPGETTVMSLDVAGVAAPGSCGFNDRPYQCVSGDGRYVVFESDAALVADDTNGVTDIYLRDRMLGVTRRVSVAVDGSQGNAFSRSPAISANGRYVAFESGASNLVPNDTNGTSDIFVRDLFAGTTERVNLTAAGAQSSSWGMGPSISADGRYVLFSTTAALVPGDLDTSNDVYVRDRVARTTRRVSVRSDGTGPNDQVIPGTISADGRFVAFTSWASNLVAGDVNGEVDVFVRDMQTGAIERATVGPNDVSGGGYRGSISADGRYVVFSTSARLVSSDSDDYQDIYVRDRSLGTTERITVSSSGGPANYNSQDPAISGDGRFVVFQSYATNLVNGDTNRRPDVFVRDRWNGTTERASIATSGLEGNGSSYAGSVSADGAVAYTSSSTNLGSAVPGVVYVHELGGPKIRSYRLDPLALAFGPQTITTGRSLSMDVINTGTVPIWVASVALSGNSAADFSLSNICRGWVQPTARCSTKVTFRPGSVGDKVASLDVTAADKVVQSAALTGTGVLASYTATPSALAFGTVAVGTVSPAQKVVITNTGLGVLPIKSISLGGVDASQFRRYDDCANSVPSGGSCTTRIRFAPTGVGAREATLTIRAGGGAGPKVVQLSGTGR